MRAMRLNRLGATVLAAAMLAAAMLVGCKGNGAATEPTQNGAAIPDTTIRSATALISPSKDATTQPVNNDVTGAVVFTQHGNRVLVVAHILGLEPNSRHGIHIHALGDLSAPDLSSAGGHFNPYHHAHGAPGTQPVHAGDLGNLDADANGNAHLELEIPDVTIGTGRIDDIVGKSVIIHAKADDLSSQPAGNSGARIAGGVIRLK